MKYGPAVREAILRRILSPQSEPLSHVSRDTGISVQTLINWKTQALASGQTFTEETETEKLSSKEKFRMVVESEALNETELAEYARSKGVFVEQLRQWREICENANGNHAIESVRLNKVIKEKDKQIKAIQADLVKKDRALAEVTALEILRKKAQAIWGEPEGE